MRDYLALIGAAWAASYLINDVVANSKDWDTEVDGDAPVDVIVLVSGVVQRGQLVAIRVPLRDAPDAAEVTSDAR
jgi:hypothetical protein